MPVRFPEEVGEIVTTAQNELKIEVELGRIEAAWRSLVFEMGQYKDNRGFVLKANENLKQLLEDNILTLQ